MSTVDPLACTHAPHPPMRNVADLERRLDVMRAENAALRGYVDRACLDLARSHGTSVEVERLRLGIGGRS